MYILRFRTMLFAIALAVLSVLRAITAQPLSEK
jgi:hypothetical protein